LLKLFTSIPLPEGAPAADEGEETAVQVKETSSLIEFIFLHYITLPFINASDLRACDDCLYSRYKLLI
jgi:hypothetical protein